MQETWVHSLGWEDPLEKEMATHSSILAWRIPWTEEPGRSTGSQRVGHDWATSLTHSLLVTYYCSNVSTGLVVWNKTNSSYSYAIQKSEMSHTGLKSKFQMSVFPFMQALENNLFLYLLSARGCSYPLACGISSSIFKVSNIIWVLLKLLTLQFTTVTSSLILLSLWLYWVCWYRTLSAPHQQQIGNGRVWNLEMELQC